LIRITLKVLQETGESQALQPSAPPPKEEPVVELEVRCSTLMES